jgi:hypothetical protein
MVEDSTKKYRADAKKAIPEWQQFWLMEVYLDKTCTGYFNGPSFNARVCVNLYPFDELTKVVLDVVC